MCKSVTTVCSPSLTALASSSSLTMSVCPLAQAMCNAAQQQSSRPGPDAVNAGIVTPKQQLCKLPGSLSALGGLLLCGWDRHHPAPVRPALSCPSTCTFSLMASTTSSVSPYRALSIRNSSSSSGVASTILLSGFYSSAQGGGRLALEGVAAVT